ncbi:CPBP family intramembrane glutamic endopeptidase [Myxococcus sp. 1LA]
MRLRTIGKVAAGTFALTGATTGLFVLVAQDAYAVNFEATRFFMAVLLVLLVTPIQCGFEELLYRGWVMQGVYRLVPRPWVAVAVSSVLFWASHLSNPEAAGMAAYYLVVGALLSWVTLQTGRLEPAIGLHLGINMCALLVATPATTAFQPAGLFLEVQPNLVREFALIVILAAGSLVMLRRHKHQQAQLPVAMS